MPGPSAWKAGEPAAVMAREPANCAWEHPGRAEPVDMYSVDPQLLHKMLLGRHHSWQGSAGCPHRPRQVLIADVVADVTAQAA